MVLMSGIMTKTSPFIENPPPKLFLNNPPLAVEKTHIKHTLSKRKKRAPFVTKESYNKIWEKRIMFSRNLARFTICFIGDLFRNSVRAGHVVIASTTALHYTSLVNDSPSMWVSSGLTASKRFKNFQTSNTHASYQSAMRWGATSSGTDKQNTAYLFYYIYTHTLCFYQQRD